jgi:two-component system sensor kinase FixL
VLADRPQVEQLLVNLIKNAIEAAAGSSEPRVTAAIRARSDRSEIRFEIADNGPGVPAAVQPRLFEPHVTGREGGHGFGLAVAYRIARDHDGRIEVSSEPGHGATFAFVLPSVSTSPGTARELSFEKVGKP